MCDLPSPSNPMLQMGCLCNIAGNARLLARFHDSDFDAFKGPALAQNENVLDFLGRQVGRVPSPSLFRTSKCHTDAPVRFCY